VKVHKFCVKDTGKGKHSDNFWGWPGDSSGDSDSHGGSGSSDATAGCSTHTNGAGVQWFTGCTNGNFIQVNNQKFFIDTQCDIQWSDQSRNATFIILVDNQCTKEVSFTVDDPGVFEEDDDFHTSGHLDAGQFVTFFVSECIACEDEVTDTVTLTATNNAGKDSGIECVTKATATVRSSSGVAEHSPFQPLSGPHWGGGSWSPPSPPWQQNQGAFAFPGRR